MDNRLFPELTGNDLIIALRDNSDDMESRTYYRQLTDEELAVKKDELSNNMIEIARAEDAFAVKKSEHKAIIDPLAKGNKVLLSHIKTRQVEEYGTLYKIVDQDEGMTGFYNEKGELMESRRIRPDERQTTLRALNTKIS